MAAVNLKKLTPKELQELVSAANNMLAQGYLERVMKTKRACVQLCEAEGLTLAEVFFEGKNRAKVAPKFKDPNTGKTWSGRGKKPDWLHGNEQEYAITT